MKKPISQSGFTLIETLVAILILSLSVGALLALAAGGFFTVRYAKSQIIGDLLVQESIEYLKNSRDNTFVRGGAWENWLEQLSVDERGDRITYDINNPRGCFSSQGCIIDPYTTDFKIRECDGDCTPLIFYPTQGLYGYESSYPFPPTEGYESNFTRTIKAEINPLDPNQVLLQVGVTWFNGNVAKTAAQSIVVTNWHP